MPAPALPFQSAPPDDEPRGSPQTAGPSDQQTQTDAASGNVNRKALETAVARFAMRGYELRQLADGSLLVSRWNLSQPLGGLDAAEGFLRQIGGASVGSTA